LDPAFAGQRATRRKPFDPQGEIVKSTMVAILEKLLADGALHSYTIDEETIHS
jgi:hypothetical protein